ncbi:hypothetical protein L211DRAFT_86942 [Terfezia boudieri ATCC MYA-4762]|uniref:Uncharacterized protein n=1 Tax=Terfezia boudieri ATCC MYA-4762 TaxID=1051890 RepID=A0A3N4LV04_9PEZI|nr:hypothetical protein L211DRAFT_86942 [Terfezia boudieri ATCC MYA-4762]
MVQPYSLHNYIYSRSMYNSASATITSVPQCLQPAHVGLLIWLVCSRLHTTADFSSKTPSKEEIIPGESKERLFFFFFWLASILIFIGGGEMLWIMS